MINNNTTHDEEFGNLPEIHRAIVHATKANSEIFDKIGKWCRQSHEPDRPTADDERDALEDLAYTLEKQAVRIRRLLA